MAGSLNCTFCFFVTCGVEISDVKDLWFCSQIFFEPCRPVFAQKHITQDMYICIQLKKSMAAAKHRRFELTQKVKIFSGEDMVYSYPGEYYGKVQSHASENGAD